MELLTSDRMLLLVLAVCGVTYHFKCASWVIFLVAAMAASQWTNWCLCCRCFSAGGKLVEVPAVQLDWDLLPPS